MFVDFNILNQLGSPSINSNTFANRPAAGQTGRLFVSTDTFEIFRDNGTGWDLIGGPGAGTITGTGTATQVAYFTGAQTIGSSSNLFWDNTNTRLGIGTSSPGVRLDIHGTGNMLHINSTGATANTLMAFQRLGSNVWRLGDQYSGGLNYFELHNAVINNNAAEFQASTNKATFSALETYSSGGATGTLFSYTLTVPNGVNITQPNAVGAVNSYLNLSLGGNTTVSVGARQGLEGNSRISFTGAGTLTIAQGSTVRAFSALSSVYSFNGTAAGTVTHLAGLRICFPDNIGSAINITNNYGLLLNDQTTGIGTVTYTNRWGIYQEGASDLNYFNGNLLIKSTTNSGEALQVNGTAKFTNNITINAGSTNSLILQNSSGGETPNVTFITPVNKYNIDANATGSLRFFRENTDGTLGAVRMNLEDNGNLGIGTTTIGSRLQVNGNAAIGYSASTAAPTNGLAVAGGITSGAYIAALGARISSAPSAQGVYLGNSGTTSTDYASIEIVGGSAGGGEIDFTSPSIDVKGRIGYNNSSDFMQFLTNGTEKLRITSGGQVTLATGANVSAIAQTGYSLTGSNASSLLDLAGTWNTTGNPTAIKLNITNTASGATAYLMDLQVGAATQFRVTKAGAIRTAAPTTGTANDWKLGTRVAAAVVLDTTQYIELEVGGTLYKLAIVT